MSKIFQIKINFNEIILVLKIKITDKYKIIKTKFIRVKILKHHIFNE